MAFKIPQERWQELYQAGLLDVQKDGDDVTISVDEKDPFTGDTVRTLTDQFTMTQLQDQINHHTNRANRAQAIATKLTQIKNALDAM